MKANNIPKKGINIVAIVLSFIIILQVNPKENKGKTDIQKQSQEVVKIENVENTEIEHKTSLQVTSRHSITRRKNEDLEEAILEGVEGENVQQQYTKIEDIVISRDMDLSVTTGISKEDFKTLLGNVKYDTSKFFYDNSDMIYDLCQEYQINEIFFCGLISAESGWNIASNHRRTHNYISLMTRNGLIHYDSVEEGLIAAAKALHNNYLTEGGRFYNGKTLYGVKTRFCPASSTWVELVYGRMQQIMKCR